MYMAFFLKKGIIDIAIPVMESRNTVAPTISPFMLVWTPGIFFAYVYRAYTYFLPTFCHCQDVVIHCNVGEFGNVPYIL